MRMSQGPFKASEMPGTSYGQTPVEKQTTQLRSTIDVARGGSVVRSNTQINTPMASSHQQSTGSRREIRTGGFQKIGLTAMTTGGNK